MLKFEDFRLGFVRFSALIAYILIFFSIIYLVFIGTQAKDYIDLKKEAAKNLEQKEPPDYCPK